MARPSERIFPGSRFDEVGGAEAGEAGWEYAKDELPKLRWSVVREFRKFATADELAGLRRLDAVEAKKLADHAAAEAMKVSDLTGRGGEFGNNGHASAI